VGGSSDQVVRQYTDSAAHQSADAAGAAVAWLLKFLGPATEPNFTVIGPAYNRMLAIALLLAGAMISMAVAERILGGPKGAGWNVVPRTVAATLAAFAGLGVVQYGAYYAGMLATAWGGPGGDLGIMVATGAAHVYTAPTSQQAFGSAIGLWLVALITLLLTLFLYVEMILRAALILVTTAFIPLVCVMAIWPRLTAAAVRLAEFLVLLLLSKFVMVTAVYVGFSMVAYGAIPGDGGMGVGIATLLLATFSPMLLLRGIRIGETTTASAVRGWAAAGVGAATTVAWLGATSRTLRRTAGAHARRLRGRDPGSTGSGAST
jgi:hypothetical protein